MLVMTWILVGFFSGRVCVRIAEITALLQETVLESSMLFSQVLVLFMIMFVGGIAKKTGIITNELCKGMSDFVLYVSFPFLIILSFHMDYSKELFANARIILLLSLGIHAFSALAGKLIFYKVDKERGKILNFATVFANRGFMGFPLMESLFGRIGVFYCSIFGIIFNVFLWTYGIMIFTDKEERNSMYKVLFNPGIVAVMIGLAIFYFSLKLPAPVFEVLEMVGATATPLAMIIIGARLADSKMSELFSDFLTYFMAFVRLLALPFVVYLLLLPLNLDEVVLTVCILLTGMPVAAYTSIFAEKFDTLPEFASRCVFISTAFSIITIPLMLSFLNSQW